MVTWIMITVGEAGPTEVSSDETNTETTSASWFLFAHTLRERMERTHLLHPSRNRAHGSKVWAAEVMQGAPMLKERLRDNLYEWAKLKESKIREWVDSGQINPVEPSYLLYMIWASTQHYADFDYQIYLLNDDKPLDDLQFEKAVQSVTSVILRGIGLTA